MRNQFTQIVFDNWEAVYRPLLVHRKLIEGKSILAEP